MPDPSIRVLLVDMPQLLSDLFERAFRTHGVRVVGVTRHVSELAARTQDTKPDYVILSLEHGRLPAECDELFSERARPRVLGVVPADGHIDLFELRPERIPLGRMSPSELVGAVRGTAEARA